MAQYLTDVRSKQDEHHHFKCQAIFHQSDYPSALNLEPTDGFWFEMNHCDRMFIQSFRRGRD